MADPCFLHRLRPPSAIPVITHKESTQARRSFTSPDALALKVHLAKTKSKPPRAKIALFSFIHCPLPKKQQQKTDLQKLMSQLSGMPYVSKGARNRRLCSFLRQHSHRGQNRKWLSVCAQFQEHLAPSSLVTVVLLRN